MIYNSNDFLCITKLKSIHETVTDDILEKSGRASKQSINIIELNFRRLFVDFTRKLSIASVHSLAIFIRTS